jgi:excisionase family DNA binding protein
MTSPDPLIDLSGYPALLTVRDVADLLQVAVPTVRAYLRQGDLVKIKVGHGVRVSRVDLERYLAARAQPRPRREGAAG